LESVKALGDISANELLKAVQQPSSEPYWKLRYKGAFHDIFFLTIYDKLEGLIGIMNDLANEAGYPASDMGVISNRWSRAPVVIVSLTCFTILKIPAR